MENLNIKQCHEHLLGIAKEFDSICQKHHIPYYMIGGTLLGAVRHKGFIPWDDDMDFGIPIEYYDTLLDHLSKELPDPYRLCTYKTVKGCSTVFAKIDDYSTCIEDKCQRLPLNEQLGLNIDLFPLCYCNKNDKRNKDLQRMRTINRIVFTESTEGQWYKHTIKVLLRIAFPYSREAILDKIWRKVKSINDGAYFANLFGLVGEREMMPLEYYGKETRYSFENITLRGPEMFDEYLKQVYRDYMTLPPPEKRKTHATNVYKRDNLTFTI